MALFSFTTRLLQFPLSILQPTAQKSVVDAVGLKETAEAWKQSLFCTFESSRTDCYPHFFTLSPTRHGITLRILTLLGCIPRLVYLHNESSNGFVGLLVAICIDYICITTYQKCIACHYFGQMVSKF